MKKCLIIFMSSFILQLNAQEIKLVKNINPTGNANISQMTKFNGKLFFSATDGTTGQELWVSDGTESGTHLFKDINPSGSSNPIELKVCNGKLYFQAAADGGTTPGLWISDGTEAGTINISNNCHSPQEFTEMNGKVYFSAINNQYGTEFWVTDGTISGTQIVKNILTVGADPGLSSEPSHFIVYNNKIYFIAKSDATYFQLYESDGTEAGTTIFSKFSTLGQPITIRLFVSNNKLFFTPLENISDIGTNLYVYDGTNVEKIAINDSDFSNPSCFFDFNNQLAFVATTNANGNELWISDGTAAGTKMVKDIYPGTESSNPTTFCLMNNKLYFSAADTLSNMELWVSDGTENGTYKVKEINTNALNTRQSSPSELKFFHGNLFFSARPNLNQPFLFRSDGTAANTKQIDTALVKSYPPSYNPQVSNLFVVDTNLFFMANYSNSKVMLYKACFSLLPAPIALPVTNLSPQTKSYSANWTSVSGADHYLLYVSKEPDFATCVAGYNGLSVSNTTQIVYYDITDTVNYYRVVAVKNTDTSIFSNSIHVIFGCSINEINCNSLKIYPNPASNQIYLSMEQENMDRMEIYDISGKLILQQAINDTYKTINVSDLKSGVYTIKIIIGNNSINQLFIKE